MTANTLPVRDNDSRARVVGHVSVIHQGKSPSAQLSEDDFLAGQAVAPWSDNLVRQGSQRVLAEIGELQRDNRWEDIIALFHPVAEKLPELTGSDMEHEVRLKVGFALSRAKRHAAAIDCLEPVIRQDPDNALAHYSIGYTAMDALFESIRARTPLPAREKKELLAKAHSHYQQACSLRPESVTFFYRHAILYKEIEDKTRQAAQCFEKAIANWERQDVEAREKNHQQYPKYIKSMYHLGSCLLQQGLASRALGLIEKVVALDQDRNHLHPVFKHFAMGKVLHALGRHQPALEKLELAVHRADRNQPVDFVLELAARCALSLAQPEKALRFIGQVPAGRRRPYVRWTEADAHAAVGDFNKALAILADVAERDRRGRHKALIRMARIHLSSGRYQETVRTSTEAAEFCRESFGNPSHEALYWKAAGLYKLERYCEALEIVEELERHHFRFPNFNRLCQLVKKAAMSQPREQRFSLVPDRTVRTTVLPHQETP